jgi:hypothetical protein
MEVSFPQATTGLVPISYRGVLLSTLLYVSLIPTSHNRPSIYQLQKSATEPSTCHCLNVYIICKKDHHRRSIGQSVFVLGRYLGLAINFSLFSLEILLRFCSFSYYGAPSLTRGWVCNLLLQLLLGLASAVTLGPSPAQLEAICCSLI